MAYNRINCPKCDQNFGQEVKFLDHLVEIHGVADTTQLYIEIHYEGSWPTCQCSPECNARLSFDSWKKGFLSKYVRGHNARVDSVYLNPSRQAEFAKKRVDGYAEGKYKVWNAGLSKETSEKVGLMSEKISESLQAKYSSGYRSWQSGLTKETDDRVLRFAEARNVLIAKGEIQPWNKGLNKETDTRVAAIAVQISKAKQEYDPRRLTPEELVERVSNFPNFLLLTPPSEYRNKYQRLLFQCTTCGSTQEKTLTMLEATPICFSCHPRDSVGQREVFAFVQSLGVEAIPNDREVISPKELDIWVPSVKVGIEYNGLYWHSQAVKADSNYHMTKQRACEGVGVRLLSIYEDEWRDRRQVVEGMIRHRLGLPVARWDARKLEVVSMTRSESKSFFDLNHLEGSSQSITTFGLKDPATGVVVAAMSLRRPFHKKYEGQLEVGRCATLPGHSVRGWLGRLTSAARKYAKSTGASGLMTYVDGRVGAGDGYKAAGWVLESANTSPRFWWTDFVNRYNRFKYKADKSRGMTQAQVADEAGVVEIWGHPNSLFSYPL